MSVTPPPFQAQELPPRRGGNKACIWVAVGLVVCCLVMVGSGVFFFGKTMGTVSPFIGCAATMDGAAEAVRKYAADHGGKLPSAATWMDEVQPYYEKEVEEFKDAPDFIVGNGPAAPDSAWGCTWSNGKTTGLAFNADLDGKLLADIKDPTKTPLVYEVPTTARNQNMPYKQEPAGDAPAAFGNRRDWGIEFVEGGNDMGMDSNSTSVSFRTGSRKSSAKSGERSSGQDTGAGE